MKKRTILSLIPVTALLVSSANASKTPLTGDQLFATYVKSTDNATAFSVSIGGLTSGATYDLIVYADWYYNGAAGTPVTQTAGTGLTGTFVVNHSTVSDTSASVAGEDTNAADTQGLVNWTRFRGLKADGSNNLTFNIGGANSPLSGFQLIQVPEPSAALLGGLGFLVL